jgi:hypothetical protein
MTMGGMTLGALITMLEAKGHQNAVCPAGFSDPHSYRGFYEDVAFVPARNITVADMLEAARSALGATYEGWKGGDYTMDWETSCWLAFEGDTGETLGPTLVRLMLERAK